MKLYVDGVGLLGPGLAGWPAGRAILQGKAAYEATPMPRPIADLLPPTERRRCGEAVRLALHVGVEALAASGRRADDLPTVFTSASGNGEVLHQICEALATAEREVSPTRFHNSVHNAPAGYWSIATGARTPSTSLCAHQGSFAAGLLEAALQVACARTDVLLVAYDLPHPEPLASACPVIAPFAAALLLSAEPRGSSLAALEVTLAGEGVAAPLAEAGLEALRQGNAAARCLPLLGAIARAQPGRVAVEYVPRQCLAITLTPCV